jgi:hypothetical protein
MENGEAPDEAVRAERGLTFEQAAKIAERDGMLIYPTTRYGPEAAMPPGMWDECQQEDESARWRAIRPLQVYEEMTADVSGREMVAALRLSEADEKRATADRYEAEALERVRQAQQARGEGQDVETLPWTLGDIIVLGSEPTQSPDVLPCGDKPGLFYRRQRNMLSGEAAVGKTWLALYAAVLEIAAGGTVVWIDADNMGPSRLLERLRLLASAQGVDDADLAERFRYVRPEAPAGEKSISAMLSAEPKLVVFDSLNPILGLHSVDTSSTTEVDAFFRALLDPLTDAGTCALMLDHVPKDKGNRGRYAYGSERKLTGVDVHLTMRTHKPFSRERGGEAFLDVAKDRDGHVGATGDVVGAFALETVLGRVQAGLREVSAFEADWSLSLAAENIAAALADGEARSQTWIEDNTTGARATTKREALGLLQVNGHVAVTRGPRNARLFQLVQPYTLTEDGPLGADS